MPLKLKTGLQLAPLIMVVKMTPPSPRSVSSEVTFPASLRPAPLMKHAMKLTTLAYPAGLSVSSGPLQLPQLVSDKLIPAPLTLLVSQTKKSMS